ncbi:helix-turn-helix domain-containing protein [Streptomyces sp. NPDC020951]|uniref:helix-turn-helix domain-containing protein n=1 Tax=Streptomyces sp. NPDC020951 TaxID=3365104 RepID=UPI0037AF64D6
MTSSPGGARLTAALKELKDRTGLSLARLAAETTFSKSSWERYLNGRSLPPRQAVQELCRLAGEPDGRCLALWEIAKSEESGRPKDPPRTPPQPSPPLLPPPPSPSLSPSEPPSSSPSPSPEGSAPVPVGHRGAAAAAILASVCAVVFGAVAVTLVLLPEENPAPRPSATRSTGGPQCRTTTCEGKKPAAMNCAGSPDTLAEHVTATGASIQLRYSRVCGTSWARMWGARIGDRIESGTAASAGRPHTARVENKVEADTYVTTDMTATVLGTVVKACFLPVAGGAKECFEARAAHG